jgi:glycerophosphoryl diester phosphodiesterase
MASGSERIVAVPSICTHAPKNLSFMTQSDARPSRRRFITLNAVSRLEISMVPSSGFGPTATGESWGRPSDRNVLSTARWFEPVKSRASRASTTRRYRRSITSTPIRWPYLDWPHPIAFAHRGDHRTEATPENSMAAFAAAVALGYRWLETDVHATADGVLVAFHDDHLDRVTDRTGAIGELRWQQVREAKMANGEPPPLLEDLLGAWPDVRVNVDAKHDAAVEPLVAVLDRTAAHDRVCLAAFSDRRLTQLRALTGGRVCTALGPREVAKLKAASLGAPARFAGACAQVPLRQGPIALVDRRFVNAAHRRGLRVHLWTIDDAAEMGRLLDLGVDGIMTDRPDLLRDVLDGRGQW